MMFAPRLTGPAARLTQAAALLLAAAYFSMPRASSGAAGASGTAGAQPAAVGAQPAAVGAQPAAAGAAEISADGVADPQRAWQHWTLNCQGCHRPDGTGSAGTAPSLAGTVARFLSVPGGREYLGRVPGVATSPLSDADLSEVMNWMLWRFDKEHLPAAFQPFTAAEIGRLRAAPLRLEASQMRAELLEKADQSPAL
jgi:mono/diheme cytochrome c family protein